VSRGIFVTGTDTGVGKTVVAAMLLRALADAGFRAVGMKPVSAGLPARDLVNADVRMLRAAGSVDAPLADVNPYSFVAPIAPELAARADGAIIELDVIAAAHARLALRADAIVVEGAGGVLVPLTHRTDMLDIAVRLGLPALLVVGVRLGCLNHALLSAQAIGARGVRLLGWVANRIDPGMPEGDANVSMLAERMPAPLVADVPWRSVGTPELADRRRALRLLEFDGAAPGDTPSSELLPAR